MSYGLTRLSTRTKLLAGALVLMMVGVSHAGTPQVGGGATLPSIAYVGSKASSMTQVSGTNVASSSLFGASGVAVSYCLTGSGAGKNILAGIGNNSVQINCPTSGGALHGFGAATLGRIDLTQPNFAGADAPLSSTDFGNYIGTQGNHGGHNPVEFPALAGAVAIAFNLKDNVGDYVTSSEVNFSDAQLCKIFSGQVAAWNDPVLASAFTLPPGHSIPSLPINVQYRSDASGTTFAFSNHLSAACNTTTNPLETSQTFFTTTAGTTYVVQNFLGGSHPALPTNWTGSSGNSGVANAIFNTANSIGYVETGNVLPFLLDLQVADVDGKSPITDFKNTLILTTISVQANAAIGGFNNPNGTPTIVSLSNPTFPLPTSPACIVLVKPADYAVAGNSPGFINPTGNYPIVAITYLLGNSVGNGSDLANTQTLVTSPYNTAIRPNVTTIGGMTGFQYINPSITFTSSQVSNCYGP